MARRPIDEKIIRLKMDNSDLEDKASKSVALITKLKDTLNKIPGVNIGKVGDSVGKIGEEAGKSRVGLAAVADSVDRIAERFSTMGIIGTETLRRVTNTGLDMIGNLAKKAWNQTVTAGKQRAKNIEQAAFQFKGLGMDVEKAMAAANYATTGTTFGLDEAALAASALGASGVEAGDDMATALRSISGVAAMTNSTYSDTARIFTTVAGQGRLMSDQLNQFASRGLNVAAMMAEEFGITETQLREMVTQGKVSFTDFYQTMDKLFGEHAISNRQTFDGAMAAMKSSFTRIGETLWVPVLTHSRESLLTIMTFFNELHNGLKPIVADLEPYVEKFFRSFDKFVEGIDLSNFAPTLLALYNGLKNIATAVSRIVGPIVNAFRALVGVDGAPILGLAKAFEWLTSKLILPLRVSEILETVLTSITSTVNSTVMAVINGISRVITALQDIPGLIDRFTTKFVEGTVAAGRWLGDIFINIPVDRIKQFAEYLKTIDAGRWLGNIISNIPFEKLGQFGENLQKLASIFEDQFFVKDNNLLWSINNTLRIALEELGVNFDKFDRMVNRIQTTWRNFLMIFEGINLEETFSGGFLSGMASLISQIIANIDKLTNVGSFVRNIGTHLDRLASMFSDRITELNQSVFPALRDSVKYYMEQLQISTNSLKDFITDLYSVIVSKLTPAWNVFKDVMSNISLEPLLVAFRTLGRLVINVIEPIWELIKDVYNNITWDDVFAGGFLVGLGLILDNMKESFGGLKEIWDKVMGFFGKGSDVPEGGGPISKFLESISGSLSEFSDTMKESVSISRIVAVATAIGIMAFAFSEIADLDTQQIANGMVAISTAIFTLSSGMKALDFVNLESVGSIKIIAFATSIKILTGALKSVGELDPTTIGAGAVGLASAMGILVGSLKLMDGVRINIAPVQLIAMGVAIRLMAGTVLFAGNMSGGTLLKGTATIGLLLAEFGMFGRLMDGIHISPTSVASLYLVSGVLTIMTGIIGILSFIDGKDVATGVAAIGSLLVALGVFGKLTERVYINPGTGLAMIGIATGMAIMSTAVKKLGEIDTVGLVKGLSSVMILLIGISSFSQAMNAPGMVQASAATGMLAAALTLMVIPIKQLGGMDLASLAKGIGGLAVALVAMGAAMKIAGPASLSGGAAFVLLAVGINLIIPPLERLSGLEWGDLISSLGKFVLAVVAIGGIAALLGTVAPLIMGFATAIVVLGAGFSLIGVSLALFGTGLATLAALSVTTIAGAIASLGLFLSGLNRLLPTLGRLITDSIQLVIDIVLGVASTIIDAVLDVIYMLLAAIRDNVPRFVDVGVDIILALMDGLRDNAHELADAAVELIVTLIDALAEAINEHGPKFIEAFTKLFGSVLVVVIAGIEAVMNALFGGIPGVKNYLEEKFGEATEAVREQFNLEDPVQEEVDGAKGVLQNEGPELVRYVGGIADDASLEYNRNLLLEEHTEEETEAILEAWRLSHNPLTSETAELAEGSTTSYINNLLMGKGTQEEMDLIGANISKAKEPTGAKAEELAKYADSSFRSVDTAGAGVNFTRGISIGMQSRSSMTSLWNAATNIGNSVLRTLNFTLGNRSPSIYTKQSGIYLMEGLTLGMDSMNNKVRATASGMGQLALDATNSALNGALSEFDTEVRVKVVLDTSDFDNWNPEGINPRRLDTSFTNGMVEASQPYSNQNENKMSDNSGKESIEYNYDLHLHTTGGIPRSEIRRMAYQFKEEIESIDRRERVNRGEEVVF